MLPLLQPRREVNGWSPSGENNPCSQFFHNLLVREGKDLGEESKGETLEGANDPKTVGDMQSHIAMFYGIRKAFPDINVISEEHGEKTVDLNSVPKLETSNPEVRTVQLNINTRNPLCFRLTILTDTMFLRRRLRCGLTHWTQRRSTPRTCGSTSPPWSASRSRADPPSGSSINHSPRPLPGAGWGRESPKQSRCGVNKWDDFSKKILLHRRTWQKTRMRREEWERQRSLCRDRTRGPSKQIWRYLQSTLA